MHELESKILEEINVFENDLNNPIEFIDNVAKLKDYRFKTIEIFNDNTNWYDLIVNGKSVANIVFDEEENKYSAYDGVDGYGWHETIKQAVKIYMEYNYNYPTNEESDRVICSNCGDGGCIYCDQKTFL